MNKLLMVMCMISALPLQAMQRMRKIIKPAAVASRVLTRRLSTQGAYVYKHFLMNQKQEHYQQLLNKPWAKISQKYLNLLALTHNELEQHFFELTRTTPESFQQLKSRCALDYERAEARDVAALEVDMPIEASVRHLLHESLSSVGIPSASIGIRAAISGSRMGATQSNILVSPLACQVGQDKTFKTQEELRGIVKHEIAHLLHDDSFEDFVMQRHIKNYGNNQRLDQLMLLRERNCEIRSDIIAGLSCIKTVKALIDFFERSKDDTELDTFSAHPSNKGRAQYLLQLHAEMLAAVKGCK